MLLLAASTPTTIYYNPSKTESVEVVVMSDSTTITQISKEPGAPYNSAYGLTAYNPLRAKVGPGEKLIAYSTGTPNLSIMPDGHWIKPL